MSYEQYSKNELWPILVETVHSLVMYPSHKAYTREAILAEKPNIEPADLSSRLNISLGEAIVILAELNGEKTSIA